MTTKSNISTSQTLKTGITTTTAHTITTLPTTGSHSFHNRTDNGLISIQNCVWPAAFSGGGNHKSQDPTVFANSAVGVSVVNGLTINMRDQSGNVSVTFS